MKDLLIFLCVGFVLCSISCKKTEELPGTQDVTVNARIVNTLTGPGTSEPWKSKTVHVSDAPGGNSFLFSATTDANGMALFEGLNKDGTYWFFGSEVIGTVAFEGEAKLEPGVEVIDLKLITGQNGQNGYMIMCVDQNNDPVPDLQVCVFTNANIAANGECSVALQHDTTDQYGRVFLLDVAAATYTARIRKADQGIDGTTSFTVGADSITTHTYPVTLVPTTGLRITCRDSSMSVLRGIHACVYTSQTVAGTYDCTLAAYEQTSNVAGALSFLGIPAQDYYVHFANDTLNVNTIVSFTVTPQMVTQADVILVP